MNDLTEVNGKKVDREGLLKAFNEIQIPRPRYVLEHMVVGSHDTPESQYAHCVLEAQVAYDNLRKAQAGAELKRMEIAELGSGLLKRIIRLFGGGKKDKLNKLIKEVELEQLQRAMLGAYREFAVLYEIWEKFPTKFTREQLDSAEPQYWLNRLTRQANQDIIATGRIGQGNQDALRQIGKPVMPQFDYARGVEARFLAEGNIKLLVCVASAEKMDKGIPCLANLKVPGPPPRIHNAFGKPVADNYNECATIARDEGYDFMITVEVDTFPQPDALIRLLKLARENQDCAVGAWYPKKEAPRQGVHIVIRNGVREFLEDDGQVHEVYTLAMGCSIFPVSMFIKIPQPWFVTTKALSQDSFFSQVAREYGYKLLVDTSVKCKHVDLKTNTIFE